MFCAVRAGLIGVGLGRSGRLQLVSQVTREIDNRMAVACSGETVLFVCFAEQQGAGIVSARKLRQGEERCCLRSKSSSVSGSQPLEISSSLGDAFNSAVSGWMLFVGVEGCGAGDEGCVQGAVAWSGSESERLYRRL